MNLLTEFEQEFFASPVVEPDDGEQVVAASAVLPVVTQEFLVGVGELPLIIGCEDGDNALVATPFIVVLQNLECQHVCPELPAALILVDGTKETISLAASQDALYPELRLFYHRLVIQDVSKVGIAAEPVWNFLPAMTATGFEPCVALLVEPVADFAELTAQAVLLPDEHLAHPSAGNDGCGSQFDKRIGRQRSSVVDVEGRSRLDLVGLYHA